MLILSLYDFVMVLLPRQFGNFLFYVLYPLLGYDGIPYRQKPLHYLELINHKLLLLFSIYIIDNKQNTI